MHVSINPCESFHQRYNDAVYIVRILVVVRVIMISLILLSSIPSRVCASGALSREPANTRFPYSPRLGTYDPFNARSISSLSRGACIRTRRDQLIKHTISRFVPSSIFTFIKRPSARWNQTSSKQYIRERERRSRNAWLQFAHRYPGEN